MPTTRRTLATLAAVALLGLPGTGCGADPGRTGPAGGGAGPDTARAEGVRFAGCMRDRGVREFPDPDASGELTADGILNGSELDPESPVWKAAIAACRHLQPAGFTGRKRDREQQRRAVAFARCMRENGVRDFPDPTEDGPLIDTTRIPSAAGRGALEIPGFQEAQDACRETAERALEGR